MTDDNIINEQVLINTSKSSSQSDKDTKVIFKVGSSSSVNTDIQFQKENCLSSDTHKNNYEMKEIKSIYDSSQLYDKDYSPERDLEDLLSIVEPCQDISKASSEVDSGAASDSIDTSFAHLKVMSLTESEFTPNENISSKVSNYSKFDFNLSLVML